MLRVFSFLFFFLMFPSLSLFSLQTERLAEHLHKTEKPSLFVFLSNEGCPWCDKLGEEILDRKEFKESIAEEFNFLKIYISDVAKEKILSKYHIDQVPVFVLVSKEGEELLRLGYSPKGPQEMATHIKTLFKRAEALQEKIAQMDPKAMPVEILRHCYTEAQKIGIKKLQDHLLKLGLEFDPSTFFLLEKYKSCLGLERKKAKQIKEEIKNRDPDNHEGSQLHLAFLEFQARQDEKMDIHQVVKPLKKYLKHFGEEDKENRWRVEMTLTHYYFSHSDKVKALEYAQKALQDAPLESQEEIRETIRYIKEVAFQ